MRRLLPALLLAAAAATPAAALDLPPLCRAMHGLADAARASREPQRLSMALSGACQPTSGAPAAGRAFCDAAAAATAADGPHMLPWAIESCVANLAAEPQLFTTDGDVGPKHRKRLSRLTANLSHGVRLDVSLQADRYDLVVWSLR